MKTGNGAMHPELLKQLLLDKQRAFTRWTSLARGPLATLYRLDQILTEIHEALCRIEQGVGGICVKCGQPISSRLLHDHPWARICFMCNRRALDRLHTHGDCNGGNRDNTSA